MTRHEEIVDLLKKYYKDIETTYGFSIIEDLPQKKIDRIVKAFASGVDKDTLVGFYDTTISGNGKTGYLFMDTKVYYHEALDKPKKLWYDDIKNVEIFDGYKKDCDKGIRFFLYDGAVIEWKSCFLNKTPLILFFKDVMKLVNATEERKEESIDLEEENNNGIVASGAVAANYREVNTIFEEEKFHARQGHGFAAERANTLIDKMTGHDAKIVGDDNAKNGADRIVDGVYIQSKYCSSGQACVDECFNDAGVFRYLNDGQPMQIEVPSDKYDAAVNAMQEKIKNGQVPGVNDPLEAENIIRKGHFTYEQARNIAKAGTVESLAYDALNGVITASTAFGITAVLTFAINLWNGEAVKISLKKAAFSGLKVGGTAFAAAVLATQLSKAGLNSLLVGSSETVVAVLGHKAVAVLINAFRSGSNIYGAVAMKSAAKLLRGNAILMMATFAILSSVDIANIFRGRISGKQLFKNMTNTGASLAAGTGGWIGGAAIGSMVLPGVGTIIGGLAGSLVAGVAGAKASGAILDQFIEDDADEMVRIIEKVFSELASDYLLNQKEAERVVDKLKDELKEDITGKILKNMFASTDRKQFARELLVPLIENEVKKRRFIKTPTDEEMTQGLKMVLEEIADSENEKESGNEPLPA